MVVRVQVPLWVPSKKKERTKMSKSSSSVATPENEVLPGTEEEIKVSKGWVVVVYNDDYHTFDYVIECLCSVIEATLDEAVEFAVTIHESGEAAVAGPMSKNEAESISSRIASFGPDKNHKNPKENTGLRTSIKEV